MKKFSILLLFLFSAVSIFAQAPEKMSYQAVLRDASNTLLTNQEVGVQISILQGTITGTAVYTETQTATTNINGLVSIEIGSGTSSDDFSAIDWSAGPYFIKTATDPSGASSYTIIGTSQLMSVPFAMYAKTSGGSQANATNISKNTADIATNVTAITANTDKVGYTEALVSANTDVGVNTSKVGITTQQSDAIVANTAKDGITSTQANEIITNNAKTGITAAQANEITTNNAKTGITEDQASAITDNTAKVGYTDALVSDNEDVVLNKSKVGQAAGTTTGDMQYWNGTAWVVVAVTPNEGATLQLIAGIPTWVGGTPPPAVGDFRYGGVVFWVNPSDNTHGLVCAIEDQSSGIRWYNGNYTNTGATSTAIGTGSANTTAIIANQGATETAYAAGLARAYSGGGYTDWFLPSKDALNEMHQNRATINSTATANGGSTFVNNSYWSSTEDDIYYAWKQDFLNGSQNYDGKYNTNYVRAVRAF
jgi:hypothetical protein